VTDAPRIGLYVHHHGGGHAARAGAIGRALGERGGAVTYLSSLSPELLGPGECVELSLDTDREPGAGEPTQSISSIRGGHHPRCPGSRLSGRRSTRSPAGAPMWRT
jgi:hypothetical protein